MSIHWYGERGIVNSLVTQLDRSGLDAGKSLLNCIQWGAPSDLSWINQISQIDFVVEIGLNSFGDPDLIVVCKTLDGSVYIVFIEAKAKTYEASLELDGYSRINRQLTLKYRFAVAQQRWRGHLHEAIDENSGEADAYFRPSETATVVDKTLTQRRIAKRSVLAILKQVGLVGIPLDRIYYVAWTWDKEPFFNAENFLQSEFRPMFMDTNRNEVLSESLTRIGWLSYESIFKCDGLRFLHAELRAAFATMLDVDCPQIAYADVLATDVPALSYRSFSANEKNEPLGHQYNKIRDEILTRFKSRAISEYETGLSLTLQVPGGNNKAVLKLVPAGQGADARLVLGVTTALKQSLWGGTERVVRSMGGRKKQPFFIIEIPSGDLGDALAFQVLDELDAFVSRAD